MKKFRERINKIRAKKNKIQQQREEERVVDKGFNAPDITPSNSSDDDDALSYFQRLAEE